LIKIHKIILLLVSICFTGCNNFKIESVELSRIGVQGNEDKVISDQIKIYSDSMSKLASNINFDKIIGYSESLFTMNDFDEEYFNTSLGNLIADAIFIQSDSVFKIKENKNIDFVLQNHGGIRSSLFEGEVKTEDIFRILPFENEIVVLEIPGDTILEIISFLLNENKPHAISGLKINGEKFYVNNRLIDYSKIYYVATNDYLLEGGDNMFFFKKNKKVYKLNYSIRDAFIDYIKSKFKLYSKIDNRFIKNG
tara:strand:- start:9498 stop:10253 length:756 start_codon:yes stop_codon:yes gene_type:complete